MDETAERPVAGARKSRSVDRLSASESELVAQRVERARLSLSSRGRVSSASSVQLSLSHASLASQFVGVKRQGSSWDASALKTKLGKRGWLQSLHRTPTFCILSAEDGSLSFHDSEAAPALSRVWVSAVTHVHESADVPSLENARRVLAFSLISREGSNQGTHQGAHQGTHHENQPPTNDEMTKYGMADHGMADHVLIAESVLDKLEWMRALKSHAVLGNAVEQMTIEEP